MQNRKTFITQPKHIFDKMKSFGNLMVLGVAHIDPFLHTLGPKMAIFRGFTNFFRTTYSAHCGINPLKNPIPFFLAKPPLNQQTAQAPLFRHPHQAILIFCNCSPSKLGLSVIPKNIKVFHPYCNLIF